LFTPDLFIKLFLQAFFNSGNLIIYICYRPMASSLSVLIAAMWLIISFSNLSSTSLPSNSQLAIRDTTATIVYVVRHAEKNTGDPSEKDPDLSPIGYQRAEALRERLASVQVSAAFATPYRRNQLTLTPLAKAQGIDLQSYEAQEYTALVKAILDSYRGKTVVVAGHSNSVLEIIEAFNIKRPLPSLSDQDYDFLFRIRIPRKGQATVQVMHYGKSREEDDK
jgi:broad specificity phosphatase PhoE